MSPCPLTLLLPFELAEYFSLSRLLASDARLSAKQAYRRLLRFAVSGPEQRFVVTLLRAKTNLWLFRCNQTQFCGDFVVVDMSGPKALRKVHVLELKAREPARVLERKGGVQLARWREALGEIAEVHGVVEATAAQRSAQLVRGGEDEVLAHLGVVPV